jgi:hypothetical protein
VLLAVLLTGCWGRKGCDEKDDSLVLLKINGKPAITKSEFDREITAMVGNKMDPTLLPKATQRKVMDDLARFEASVEAAKKAGYDRDPDFKKAYREQKRRLKKVALVRFYDKKKFDEIKVTPKEAKTQFDKNKSRYVKEEGGVLTSGVLFTSKGDAEKFYDEARKKSAEEFESAGRKSKGKFRAFGRVSKEAAGYGYAPVPAVVKNSAIKLSRLPGVDFVKDGKDFWVIHASDKKDAVFYKFDEISERIENQLKVNKFMAQRNKMFEDLKKELNVEVNEEYFKEAAPAATPGEGATPAA